MIFLCDCCSVSDAVKHDNVHELEQTLRQTEVDELVLVCGMMHAAQVGSVQCLQALLRHGLDPNTNDLMFGETALMKGCRQGNIQIIDYLLSQNCYVNARAESNGESALHVAVRNRQIGSLKRLIAVPNINLNIMDKQGRTPLMVAAIYADPPIICVLLDAGCDPDRFSFGGLAAIHHALNPRWQTSGYINAGENLTALLNAGISPDMCDENGQTPIHYAINVNNIKAVKLLIHYNCDVNWAVGRPNVTPVMAALKRLNLRVAKILQAAGCHFQGTLSFLSDEAFLRPSGAICRQWLEAQLSKPISLKSSCRHAIRQRLEHFPWKSVTYLPLPKTLREYVLMSEVRTL